MWRKRKCQFFRAFPSTSKAHIFRQTSKNSDCMHIFTGQKQATGFWRNLVGTLKPRIRDIFTSQSTTESDPAFFKISIERPPFVCASDSYFALYSIVFLLFISFVHKPRGKNFSRHSRVPNFQAPAGYYIGVRSRAIHIESDELQDFSFYHRRSDIRSVFLSRDIFVPFLIAAWKTKRGRCPRSAHDPS